MSPISEVFVNIVKKSVWAVSTGLLSLAVIGYAAPAAAADGADIDVAYQYAHVSQGGESESLPAGFAAGVAVPVSGPWSVVGDFSWNRKTLSEGGIDDLKFTATSFGGGLRFTPATMSQFMPYVQAVIGAEHDKVSSDSVGASDSSNNLMFQPGVGGAINLSGALKGFAEIDYRWVKGSDGGDAANVFLIRVGVIIPVGKK
jgi:hypothetical protein